MVISLFKTLLTDLENRITDISVRDYAPGLFSLERLSVVLSLGYKAGVRLRVAMYRTGILKSKKLACPVISIGNITAGGSGKTPVAQYLGALLTEMGHRPVVVSRGYGGNSKKKAAVVGDGSRVFMDAGAAGDEPYMMAQGKCFPVVVGKRRYDAGRLALERFDSDLIIMDDGFQHMALARDLNLVLFDYDSPLGNGRMLPAGRLRESVSTARERIHAIILTRCPVPETGGPGNMASPAILSRFPGMPFFYTRHQPFLSGFYPQTEKEDVPDGLGALKKKRAVLFSGISRNDSFRETITRFGVKVVGHLEFQDHYSYKRADFKDIQEQTNALGADVILTTEKDWVKVERGAEWETDIAVVGIRIAFENPESFKLFVKSRLYI